MNAINTDKFFAFRPKAFAGVCFALALKYALRLTTGLACVLWFSALTVRADRYVVMPGTPGGTNAGAYTNWTIAATQIQWAVNVATTGDTVWVTNGTYWLTNQIAFTTGITVRSVNGRDVTIVNGNYPAYTNRCFWVTNANALVQGFTITNEFVFGHGGGVYLQNGATVRDCLISGNTAKDGNGGGVYIQANGTVDLCSVVGNVSTGSVSGGGGIFFSGGGTVTNSTIARNLAVITNNPAYYAGGGGAFLNGGGLIQNCVIASNNAQRIAGFGGGGGVMFLSAGSVINTIINGNTNSENFMAGGVFMGFGGTLRNCLIINNKEGNTHTAGVNIYPPGTVQNCTIAGNMGNNGGLSIWGYADSLSLIENCIIVSNYTYAGSLNNWTFSNQKTNIYIVNTSTFPTNFPASPATTNYVNTSGCISNDPSFVNYSAGDYRLTRSSPGINAGTNRAWMSGAVDLDGRGRMDRFSGKVDMGCYEYLPSGTMFRVQ